MKNQIKLIELAGPLRIGSHSGGAYIAEGSGEFECADVGFFLLPTGRYRATVNNERGFSRGGWKADSGETVAFERSTLNAVIEDARIYCRDASNDINLLQACRIAEDEAWAWFRQNEIIPNPLSDFTTAQLCDELKRRHAAGRASTGGAA